MVQHVVQYMVQQARSRHQLTHGHTSEFVSSQFWKIGGGGVAPNAHSVHRNNVGAVQGYLADKKQPPPQDHHMTLGKVLL